MSRRFQFGLGTLLSGIILLSALLFVESRAASTQREVVTMVLSKGGEVHYRHQETIARRASNNSEPQVPGFLRQLLGDDHFQTVTAVFLTGDSFNDDDLATVGLLETFGLLALGPDTPITKNALRRFKAAHPNCEIGPQMDLD